MGGRRRVCGRTDDDAGWTAVCGLTPWERVTHMAHVADRREAGALTFQDVDQGAPLSLPLRFGRLFERGQPYVGAGRDTDAP